uniref:Protein kinase domain-containing protein n=1 Tax=Arcella intermedia TaxID=1963864 RepID=A0A6B2L2E0_9EUKA
MEDALGSGSYGTVYRGKCGGTPVAVKIPKKQKLTAKEIEDFNREINLMRQIFHPNVVLCMGACLEPDILIVTELMETDLDHFLHEPPYKGRSVPAQKRLQMARGAAQGMSWLHSISNIIHRDLKPANLLIDKNMNVKVTDFGFSQILKGNNTLREGTIRGSALWMSPEILATTEFDKSSDVYAFAVILWEIFTLEEPWQNIESWEELAYKVVDKDERPPFNKDFPHSLRALIQAGWQRDRRSRPSFDEVIIALDEVMADLAIEDDVGREFWTDFFLDQDLEEVVEWKQFTLALSDRTGLIPERFEFLKPFLVGDSDNVTFDTFNYALLWFGNGWLLEERCPSELLKIKTMFAKPWFHGLITTNEATSLLRSQTEGTYMIRFSKTIKEYPSTLSYVNTENKISHLRIAKTKDGPWKIQASKSIEAKSLEELLLSVSDVLSLKTPCPPGPNSSYATNI